MKKIIFILAICLGFISCGNNTVRQMDAPFTRNCDTPINIFDTLNFVKANDLMDAGNNITSPEYGIEFEHRQLHIKYENRTLWAYYDTSDIKTFNDIVYTDVEEITKFDSGLDGCKLIYRLLYNSNTGDIVMTVFLDCKVLYEIDDIEEKKELERVYSTTANCTYDTKRCQLRNISDLNNHKDIIIL